MKEMHRNEKVKRSVPDRQRNPEVQMRKVDRVQRYSHSIRKTE